MAFLSLKFLPSSIYFVRELAGKRAPAILFPRWRKPQEDGQDQQVLRRYSSIVYVNSGHTAVLRDTSPCTYPREHDILT